MTNELLQGRHGRENYLGGHGDSRGGLGNQNIASRWTVTARRSVTYFSKPRPYKYGRVRAPLWILSCLCRRKTWELNDVATGRETTEEKPLYAAVYSW